MPGFKDKCNQPGARNCTDGNQCYLHSQACDQIANCPNGEDEDLAQCEDKFPALATMTCQKKDSYNLNIFIKAVPCDGIAECHGDIDESSMQHEDCLTEVYIPGSDFILTIVLMTFIVFSTILVFVMWKAAIKNLVPYLR